MKAANITFCDGVPGISVAEHRYWKDHFEKILKVGVELEFNLKIESGECKGYNPKCVCDHYTECSPIPCIFSNEDGYCTIYYDTVEECEYVDTDTCSGECDICPHAKHTLCNNDTCLSYLPVCVECENSTVACGRCKEYVNNRVDPGTVRRDLASELQATNSFGVVGDTGVLQVVGDGSLVNRGLEIPTVGRRYNFYVFRDMISNIIDKATKAGGYIDSRCSIHTHILNDYYTKLSNDNGRARNPDAGACMNITSLEKPFPNIILYNVIQIWRKYESALFWMSMGLSDANHMTRWTKFRYPLLYTNPLLGLKEVTHTIRSAVGKSKYGALNIKNSLFDGSRLHLEFRTMDFVKSPTYISAMCALFKAIVLKAIDISAFGVMDVDNDINLDRERTYLSTVANNHDKGYDSDRLSTTEHVMANRDYYIKKSNELLDFITTIIPNDSPEMMVLRHVATYPPAVILISASCPDPENNYDIEAEYAKVLNKETTDPISEYILKIAALGNIHSCQSEENWVREVYEEYGRGVVESKSQLSTYVSRMVDKGMLVWDTHIKAFRNRI